MWLVSFMKPHKKHRTFTFIKFDLYLKKIPTTSTFQTHVNFPNSCLHHPNCPLKPVKVPWRKVLETDRATWAPFIDAKRSKTSKLHSCS